MSSNTYYPEETAILIRDLLGRSDLYKGTQMRILVKMNMEILKALLELMGEVTEDEP